MSRPPLPGLPQGKPRDPRAAEREAADRGLLVESGWLGLRALWISDDAPAIQIEEMRNAFFAGAQHVFGMLTGGALDEGPVETEADLVRMNKLQLELSKFHADFQRRRLRGPMTGHAAAALAG